MSANSVLPPADGMSRADSSEYFAGTALNELSECHSRLPRLNSRRRSSRARSWLFLSRLEMSLTSIDSRRSLPLRDVARRLLQRAEVAAEGQLGFVGEVLVVEHQHAVLVHAGRDRRGIGVRQRPGDVDAGDLAREERARHRVDRRDGQVMHARRHRPSRRHPGDRHDVRLQRHTHRLAEALRRLQRIAVLAVHRRVVRGGQQQLVAVRLPVGAEIHQHALGDFLIVRIVAQLGRGQRDALHQRRAIADIVADRPASRPGSRRRSARRPRCRRDPATAPAVSCGAARRLDRDRIGHRRCPAGARRRG